MADYDITLPGSSVTVDGAIFTDSVNVGSGTGNYETFIALGDNDGTLAGFNSDETSPADPANQNDNLDFAKSETILLGSIPITIGTGPVASGGNGLTLGVAYYEFRTDLNEPNNATTGRLSLDAFKVYLSPSDAIEAKSVLESTGNLVYDLGAGNKVLLSEVSTGSGTDDYAVFIPVSKFGAANPSTTYLYLYMEMGFTGGDFADSGGFEEWNTQKAGALTGVKFFDINGDGVRDANGIDNVLGGAGAADDEVGIGGVTIFADRQVYQLVGNKLELVRDFNGTLDIDEQSTVTAADGSYSFYGLTLGTYHIIEQVPAGYVRTTGAFETITISTGLKNNNGTLEGIYTVDPIGNYLPRFDISGHKYIDINGNGAIDGNDASTPHAGVTIFIDSDGDGVVEATDGNGVLDAGELSTTTDANGAWSFTNLGIGYAGAKVRENASGNFVTTVGATGLTITGTSGADQTNLNFANFQYMNISGYKWNDVNGDGLWTGGESTLSTWTIILDNDNDITNGYIASDVTDANGQYSFNNLGPDNALIKNDADGVLHVYEVVEAGFNQTYGNFDFTIQSGLTITGDLGVTEEGNFGNHMLGGYVRTPGFWQNTKWMDFWDGDASVPTQAGTTAFPTGDLLIFGHTDGTAANSGDANGDSFVNSADKGLLIGDWNHDGYSGDNPNTAVVEGPEDTIFISYDNALKLINASSKQLAGNGSDGIYMLGRDVVATWLNYLAGANVGGDAPGELSPKHFVNDAVDWLQQFASNVNNDTANSAIFEFDAAVKPSDAKWQNAYTGGAGTADDIDHSAALLHGELDFYNNTGATYVPGSDPLVIYAHYSLHG